MAIEIDKLRQQFPILGSKETIYLDWAATAQKPKYVLNAMQTYYEQENANVHRGMHLLAEKSTERFEDARKTVASFIGSAPFEVVFTKSCTESLNLIAKSWGRANLKKGDTVVLSILEHHSNVVPWLQLKEEIGIEVEWVDIDDNGIVIIEELDTLLAKGNVKLVSITGLSNVLGVMPPLKNIIEKAHTAGALVSIDAAQLIAHHPIDVHELDCDFLAFSGHKLYGPTGIGVLYAKRKILEEMPPFLGGGMMIGEVTKEGFTTAEIPAKFEAGTPPIAQAIGLAAAIDWLSQFDWNDIEKHELMLLRTAVASLSTVDGLRILGKPESACVSFTIEGIHPHDLTDIIGKKGICMRAGHHCAQPLHKRLGIAASTRLSLGICNTTEDISSAVKSFEHAHGLIRR